MLPPVCKPGQCLTVLCFLFKLALQMELCKLRFNWAFPAIYMTTSTAPTAPKGSSDGSSLRALWNLILENTPSLRVAKAPIGWLLKKTECRKEAGEPAHRQLDGCNVSKVSNPVVISRVNNGARMVELPGASFLGWMNTATASHSKAERNTVLS